MSRHLVFAVITLLITFLIYVYPFMIVSHLIFGTDIINDCAFGLTILLSAALYFYLRTHATSQLLAGITHYGMGFGFIGFMIFHLAWLIAVILPESAVNIGIGSLVLFTMLGAKSLYNGRNITIESLSIASDKIANKTNIIFISDVHLGSNKDTHLRKICETCANLHYDYLLIGGDLFDSSAFQPNDLAPLKDITKPIYFVTGNHEYYVKNHDSKLSQLSDYNIQTLDNQTTDINGLNLIGISDNLPVKQQAETARHLCRKDKFNLIMVHQPGIWPIAPDNADLILSGHTHNGQIFPFTWLVRLQFKAVYGLYENLASKIYVSSGAGTWGPAMRLGTKNEIVHISLSPSK